MRILGTEPSSVILSQKRNFQKLKRDVPNVQKQAESKRGGVINPQNYNFKQHGKFWCSQTLRINRSWPYNLATCALERYPICYIGLPQVIWYEVVLGCCYYMAFCTMYYIGPYSVPGLNIYVLGHRSRGFRWPIVITRYPASVVRPSVRQFTFSTPSPEPLHGYWSNLAWIKNSRSRTSVVVFRLDPPRGRSRAGQN